MTVYHFDHCLQSFFVPVIGSKLTNLTTCWLMLLASLSTLLTWSQLLSESLLVCSVLQRRYISMGIMIAFFDLSNMCTIISPSFTLSGRFTLHLSLLGQVDMFSVIIRLLDMFFGCLPNGRRTGYSPTSTISGSIPIRKNRQTSPVSLDIV